MGLQAAVHLGHMPWALTKEEEEERRGTVSLCLCDKRNNMRNRVG
jgi:hypothetical protein